jgi:hypothetical protein
MFGRIKFAPCILSAAACCAQVPMQGQQDSPYAGSGLPPALESGARNNELFAQIRLGSSFDDNSLRLVGEGADLRTELEPLLGWTLATPQTEWRVQYAPRLMYSHGLTGVNLLSQQGRLSVEHRFTRRFRARVDSSLVLDDPFRRAPLEEHAGRSAFEGVEEAVLTTGVRTNTGRANAEISYDLTKHSSFGVGGSYLKVAYGNTAEGEPLSFHDNSWSSRGGHTFYSHHISRRNWMKVSYHWSDANWPQRNAHTITHALQYSHTFGVAPRTRLNVFVGPQYAASTAGRGERINAGPRTTRHWTASAGTSFLWVHGRNALSASLARQVFDADGVVGTSREYRVNLTVDRQWTRRWSSSWSLEAALITPLTKVAQVDHLRSLSGAFGVTCVLTPEVNLELAYWRVNQQGSGNLNYLGNLNRVSVAFVYRFARPIGR